MQTVPYNRQNTKQYPQYRTMPTIPHNTHNTLHKTINNTAENT